MNTLRKSEALELIESLKEENAQYKEQVAVLVDAVKRLQHQLAIEEAYTDSVKLSWRLQYAGVLEFMRKNGLDAYIDLLQTECTPKFIIREG